MAGFGCGGVLCVILCLFTAKAQARYYRAEIERLENRLRFRSPFK
jgi:hypothetical protein